MQPVLSLLPMRPSKEVRLAPDGSFEFTDVVPGKYTVNAGLSALASQQKQITVADQPVTGLEFSFPFAVVSGRVVSEDGTPLSDATAFKSVALSTSNNPNMIRTSIVAVRDDGSFAQVMDADLFRVYVPVLPPGYVVKSITAGATDLLKEDLRIGLEAVNVEVKVGKSSGAERVNVRGKVLDHTGAPSRALRIELCCFNSGPFERLATDIRSDGSFEFRDVPAGQHRAELQGPSPLGLRDPRVEVLPDKVTEVNLVSPPPVASSSVNLMVSVSGLPSGERSIVTFTGLSGVSSVIAVGTGASVLSLTMSNPFGDGLSAAVSNVPAGYVVKSIVANGTTDLLNGRLLLTSGGAPITISITFAPK
jgi:hypothetical protein